MFHALLRLKVESLEDFIDAIHEVQYKTTIRIMPIVLKQGGTANDRYVYVLRCSARASNEPRLFFEEKVSEHIEDNDYRRIEGEENRLIAMSKERKFQLERKLRYAKIKLASLNYEENLLFTLKNIFK